MTRNIVTLEVFVLRKGNSGSKLHRLGQPDLVQTSYFKLRDSCGEVIAEVTGNGTMPQEVKSNEEVVH